MNTIWKSCLMTVVALAFAQVWAVEAVDPEEEAAQAVEGTMREISVAQKAWNVERPFRFRVVDHQGKPIHGITVTLRADEFISGPRLGDRIRSNDERLSTDAEGYVTFSKRIVGKADAFVSDDGLPDGWESKRSGNYHFGLRGPQSIDLNPGVPGPASAPGVDAIFYLYRYRGPHPLWESRSGINGLPVDGQPIGWKPLSPTEWSTQLLGDALARTQPQLILRLWRDPAETKISFIKPLSYDPKGLQMYIPANTWTEIAMPIGGLQRIDASQLDRVRHVEAPADGYVDRLQWKYVADKEPTGAIENNALFWVKIGSDPSFYGTAEVTISWTTGSAPGQLDVRASARIILNPTPGDRLIERSLGRDETWVTNATQEQSQGLCERFPTNGQLLPGIATIPPLELGWPGDAVPEFPK